jgi:hypothetical protein
MTETIRTPEAVETPSQPIPPKAPREVREERLREVLFNRFGDNWRHHLAVILRADTLSWLLSLAEEGLQHRRAEWVKKAGGWDKLDMGARLSLGSFAADLEEAVTAVEKAKLVKMKPVGRKKS